MRFPELKTQEEINREELLALIAQSSVMIRFMLVAVLVFLLAAIVAT